MRNHVTVIPEDSVINVDGVALFFAFDTPENMHALQWHSGVGHIEHRDGKPNDDIVGLEDYAAHVERYVSLWEAEKSRLEEEAVLKPISPEEARATTLAAFINAIQIHLDQFAKTRNYDSILSAATYATSTIPKFKAEGQYAVKARDLTWAKGYAILDDVLSGAHTMSAIDEIISELPPLAWPDVKS